jgi:hypothetical protein
MALLSFVSTILHHDGDLCKSIRKDNRPKLLQVEKKNKAIPVGLGQATERASNPSGRREIPVSTPGSRRIDFIAQN